VAGKRTRTLRKEPRQARSRDTVDVIIEAATRVLSSEGYDRASTNRIAEVAGVSIGSLYQFFPNKESIFASLRQRFFEELATAVRSEAPRIRALGQRDAIRAGFAVALRVRRKNRRLQRALDEELPFVVGFDATLQELSCELAREGLDEVPVDVRPRNLELAARMCVAVLDAVTRMASIQYPEYLDSDEFLDEATELLWRYVYRNDGPRDGRRRRGPQG